MKLTTTDIALRIATGIRADKVELLSGVHAARIRQWLEQHHRPTRIPCPDAVEWREVFEIRCFQSD